MQEHEKISELTSTPIHARAWKEKALAGYDSQQIPTNNDIHKMLIIILSHWDESIWLSYHICIKSQQLMSRITNVKGT